MLRDGVPIPAGRGCVCAQRQAGQSQPYAGTPCAPPVPVSVMIKLIKTSQRFGKTEVALRITFAQIETNQK